MYQCMVELFDTSWRQMISYVNVQDTGAKNASWPLFKNRNQTKIGSRIFFFVSCGNESSAELVSDLDMLRPF